MTQPDRGRPKKAGDILLDEGLISPEDVDQVLAIQKKNRTALTRNQSRLFGMVLCDLNLVTPMDNYCALDKHGRLLSVGDFLVKKSIISKGRLDQLIALAAAEDTPFISFILDQGVVAKSLIQQILFELFHIPFRSVSDIVFEKGGTDVLSQVISREASDQHRCIPLQLNGATLLVGITDPSNLIFLRDLDQAFPQYRFTPVFIAFSGFTWFYKLVYGKNWEAARPRKKPVDLSLLMKSSIVVTDPESEKDKIYSLFDRYERVRMVHKETVAEGSGRREQFLDFVRQHHERITARYGCSRVAFSLKLDRNRLLILAAPETEAL